MRYYDSLLAFVRTMQSQVSFRRDSLLCVVQKSCESCDGLMRTQLNEFAAYLSGGDAPKLSRGSLKADEYDKVCEFFMGLGGSDGDTQLMELSGYRGEFDAMLTRQKERHGKYGGLYIKLGFLAGLAAGIMII